MKRDWDLIRKQLTDIEEERDPFIELASKPKKLRQDQTKYEQEHAEYEDLVNRICGHYELLIKSGYIEGVDVRRSIGGSFTILKSNPRLTMAGHDLLDTMRSDSLWEKIKTTGKTKGIELTFDAIKEIGASVLKSLLL